MFRSLVLWLFVGFALQISVYVGFGDKSPIPVKVSNEKKGYLNIKSSLFDYYISEQFLSMGTNKDLLPWGIEDESIYRKNHEIALAFLKLWTKLFAIEKVTKILEKGFEAIHEKRIPVGKYESAITDLCNHLEEKVNSDSVLSPVYRKMKRDIIAAYGSKKFKRKTFMQILSNYSDVNFMRMMTFVDSNRQMRSLTVNWLFYNHALVMSDDTKKNNYITGKSVVAVAKSGIREEKLQNIYDNARFKVAEMYLNDKNQDVQTEKIVTSLVHELEKRISKDNILRNALEVAKKKIKSSAEIKNFNN